MRVNRRVLGSQVRVDVVLLVSICMRLAYYAFVYASYLYNVYENLLPVLRGMGAQQHPEASFPMFNHF